MYAVCLQIVIILKQKPEDQAVWYNSIRPAFENSNLIRIVFFCRTANIPRVSVEEINSGPSVPQEMTFDTSLAYLPPRQWLADYDLANPEPGGLGPPRRDCRAQRQIRIAHPSESRFATRDPNFRASERASVRAYVHACRACGDYTRFRWVYVRPMKIAAYSRLWYFICVLDRKSVV